MAAIIAALAGFLSATGCRSLTVSQYPAEGGLPVVARLPERGQLSFSWPTATSSAELASAFFSLANDARRNGDPHSPDYFYQAAVHSWHCLPVETMSGPSWSRVYGIYHASVAGLITEGQRHCRFNGRGQMIVHQPGGTLSIPFACLGLPWEPTDIRAALVVEPPTMTKLRNYHARDGFGVSVVAVKDRGTSSRGSERFFPPRAMFAATVVLRPSVDGAPAGGNVLEFYNPLNVSTIRIGGQGVALAGDISAPFEYRLRTGQRIGFLGFLNPGATEADDGLRFLEPYQPGKIPVIFIHGLLADPSSWFDMANDLRTQPWFNERYQIWAFGYATGKPPISAAATLRNDCREAVALLDPQCGDAALRQMVLVGHSMGGLVSKMQVTYSEERIWSSVANIPFDSINADAQVRSVLAERFFFDPNPFVRRVVFIATVHGGSSFAARGIGRVSSALVERSPQDEAVHAELVAANPNAFKEKFVRRMPTSVDLLEPQDESLAAIRSLRVSSSVKLHSIIGTGRTLLLDGPGDGVVTVTSARHPGVESECFVDATHTTILHHPDTQSEVRRILLEHGTNISNPGADTIWETPARPEAILRPGS
ncbi:MAG TPA: alpha/beta fold hydrolase [Pirellulales bacterium]|nr:alpha/beta fold hydrolase [Pirellulales bacterium]